MTANNYRKLYKTIESIAIGDVKRMWSQDKLRSVPLNTTPMMMVKMFNMGSNMPISIADVSCTVLISVRNKRITSTLIIL